MSRFDLDWAFAGIPELAARERSEFAVTELPGYTNLNYRLTAPAADWILRLPRAQTDAFIDRAAEAHNQAVAHGLGIAPLPAWRNDAGASLTPTLKQSRNLQVADFEDDLEAIVEPLRRLHYSGFEFHGRESLQTLLRRHYELLDSDRQSMLAARMQQAERVLSLLEDDQTAWVPSHRDLVLGNLLRDDQQLWLIDWEYSAMASPYWDLATLCNEADLDLEQSRRLLRAYCADAAPMQESVLFDYRGLLKLLTDCWMALLVE